MRILMVPVLLYLMVSVLFSLMVELGIGKPFRPWRIGTVIAAVWWCVWVFQMYTASLK